MALTPGSRASYPSPVSIIGVGAATSVGLDAAMTAASVRAGITRLSETRFVDLAGERIVVAAASYVAGGATAIERATILAASAMQEALAPLRAAPTSEAPSRKLRLLLGAPAPRPGWSAEANAALAPRLCERTRLPCRQLDVDVGPAGHAAALAAIAHATTLIASGQLDLVLAGGVDSYQCIETLEWLDQTRRLHSERNPDGFVPGEGAGFCLLASSSAARRLRVPVLASVRAVAVTREPHPIESAGVCTGQGLTDAFHQTLGALAEGERADWTMCDMNGESYRATEWGYAYVRSGKKHRDPLEIWHPADAYGDIGAAGGAVMVALASAAWQRRYARGPRCLIWTSSDDGTRGALVLEAPAAAA